MRRPWAHSPCNPGSAAFVGATVPRQPEQREEPIQALASQMQRPPQHSTGPVAGGRWTSLLPPLLLALALAVAAGVGSFGSGRLHWAAPAGTPLRTTSAAGTKALTSECTHGGVISRLQGHDVPATAQDLRDLAAAIVQHAALQSDATWAAGAVRGATA